MQESDMSVADLIKRFEADIVFDCHSLSANYRRSAAQRELTRRGQQALPEVDEHLSKNPPSDEPYGLKTAWDWLRESMQNTIAA